MSIFAIADLHLGLSVDKPMDVFGPSWTGHVERLEKNWREKITSSDTVLIPGDISWGISMEEALADLQLVAGRLGGALRLRAQVQTVAVFALGSGYAVGSQKHFGARVLSALAGFGECAGYMVDTG